MDPDDLRYVVKMEVYAAMDPTGFAGEEEEEDDHLLELQEILEELDTSDDQVGDDIHRHMQYDLCPACAKKFSKNPLGREHVKQFDFSNN
jgi:hypothetical protein